MILDANTGAILHNDDGDELRHPASLTKMMTLYLAFETLESGRLSMSDKIKVSQEAASAAPSNLDLEPGEEITVANAIRALITKSANDVAVALAEKIGGSQANFVRLMNASARDLGMSKTHFENASGLPNPNQVTSARDMITLGLRLQDDFPSYYPLFATRAFTYNGSTHRNHNTLMNHFAGIDGIKTGYTRASGFNLVSSVRRGGRHVVGAVFGGASAGSRNGEMRNLLTRALTRASTVKTRKPAPALIAKLKSAPKLAARPAAKDMVPKDLVPKDRPPVKAAAPATGVLKPLETTKPALQIATLEDAASLAPVAEAAPLEVFKVKRVMVAPRQGPQRPAPSADETTDMAPDEANSGAAAELGQTVSVEPPVVDPDIANLPVVTASSEAPADAIAQSFAADSTPSASTSEPAETDMSETVLPKLVSAANVAPATALYENQMTMLGAADALTPPAPPLALKPAAAPLAAAKPKLVQKLRAAAPDQRGPIQKGLSPSSLQAQAATLGAGQQRVAALQTSSPGTPAATLQGLPAQGSASQGSSSQGSGRYEIQIGAYGSIDDAQRALSNVQARTNTLLAGYASVTHPVQKEGRQVFRARFRGFEAQRAASTCTELRRQAIDCFVMTAE